MLEEGDHRKVDIPPPFLSGLMEGEKPSSLLLYAPVVLYASSKSKCLAAFLYSSDSFNKDSFAFCHIDSLKNPSLLSAT